MGMNREMLWSMARSRRWAMARWAVMFAMVPGLVSLSGCGATKKAFKPSVAQQKEIGQKAAQEVPKEYKLVSGAPLARVQSVGQKLVNALPAAERQRWNYQFSVIESDQINAFALPGGPIYLFTGLLNRMETNAEVAAVLAHEMAHVYQEHWAEQVASDQQRSAGLTVLLGALDADRGWYTAAGVLNTVVGLKYSRGDEDDSDEKGLNNMVAAGFNPNGMLSLFRTLAEGGGGGSTPEFLRSHPMTNDRIKRTEDRIAKLRTAQETP